MENFNFNTNFNNTNDLSNMLVRASIQMTNITSGLIRNFMQSRSNSTNGFSTTSDYYNQTNSFPGLNPLIQNLNNNSAMNTGFTPNANNAMYNNAYDNYINDHINNNAPNNGFNYNMNMNNAAHNNTNNHYANNNANHHNGFYSMFNIPHNYINNNAPNPVHASFTWHLSGEENNDNNDDDNNNENNDNNDNDDENWYEEESTNTNNNNLNSALMGMLEMFVNPLTGRQISTNYYEQANKEFKEIIGNDRNKIKYYNKCCFVIFGNDRDFIGRFSKAFLLKAIDIIDTQKEEIQECLSRLGANIVNFYNNLFVIILRTMHEEHMSVVREETTVLLKKYVVVSDAQLPDVCCICQQDIIGDHVNLECSHYMHYTCIKKWAYTSRSCPVCRESIN